MELNGRTTRVLLENYGIRFARPDVEVAPGTDFAIEGRIDAGGHRVLGVRTAAHAVERLAPIGDAAAGVLVDGLRAHGHRIHGTAERRMLTHLLIRTSALFEAERLDAMILDVRMFENEYVVRRAVLSSPHKVQFAERAFTLPSDRLHRRGLS
jgi:hypothetical protein